MFALCFSIGAFSVLVLALCFTLTVSVRFHLFVFVYLYLGISRSKYIFYIIITACIPYTAATAAAAAVLLCSVQYIEQRGRKCLRCHMHRRYENEAVTSTSNVGAGKTKLFSIYFASAGIVVRTVCCSSNEPKITMMNKFQSMEH